MTRPLLTDLHKKDVDWRWNKIYADAFWAVKESIIHAPILAWPNPEYPLSVVYDASDFGIDSTMLQTDAEDRERVIKF